ncbi:UNVERIFIED_CONTAM: Agamous-like MADS-box protein FUL-L [Sesamum angustifolium]|uniref:Agamous-like MADS-box protein FUL-L n=1 Tax=Sesamum angustifolium TaxID=2727405 RepID=A0AAW2NLN1_9LAMI
MERIVERYERYTYSQQKVSTDSEQENWCLEYPNLVARVELLQRNMRNYSGEDLDSLSSRELHSLEQQLESALKRIRTRKEKSLQDQNNLLAKQLREKKQQQTLEGQTQQEQEGLPQTQSTFRLPQPSPKLQRIPSLTIGLVPSTRLEMKKLAVQVGHPVPTPHSPMAPQPCEQMMANS